MKGKMKNLKLAALLGAIAIASVGFCCTNVTPNSFTMENKSIVVAADTQNVAMLNGVGYATLSEAFAAVQDGDTIKLLSNLTIETETCRIADGINVTLNMNGKKITVTETATGNYELFYIYGGLTVKGNGTIELTASSNRAWNAMSTIFHNRGGELTIENGTFTHLGGTDMAYVVDNSANYYGDATTNVNGGKLTSTYIAIRNRMEQNTHGASGKAILNIAGGKIEGVSRAVWAQAASTSTQAPATGSINVSGGQVGLIDTARSDGAECMTTISGGTVAGFKGEVGELTVTGGSLNAKNVTMLTTAGEVVDFTVTEDGLYVVAPVAEIAGNSYETLVEAFAMAQDGDTIILLKNAVLESMITIAKDKTLTLDLNGKTITGVDNNQTGNFNLFINKGTFTVTGKGKITLEATNNRAWNNSSSIFSNEGGELTIENGTFQHFGGSDMAYVIDNNSTLGETTLVVNDGSFETPYRAIRLFQNNKTQKNIVVVNGGTISARAGIWMHQAGTDSLGELTVNGGTLNCGANAIVVDIHSGGKSDITINGGSFANSSETANLLLVWPFSSMSTVTSENQTTMSINGGKFNCAGEGNLIGLLEGADANSSVEVLSGSFNDMNVLNYLVSGAVVEINGDMYNDQGEMIKPDDPSDEPDDEEWTPDWDQIAGILGGLFGAGDFITSQNKANAQTNDGIGAAGVIAIVAGSLVVLVAAGYGALWILQKKEIFNVEEFIEKVKKNLKK